MEKLVALAAVWLGKKVTFYAIGRVCSHGFIYFFILPIHYYYGAFRNIGVKLNFWQQKLFPITTLLSGKVLNYQQILFKNNSKSQKNTC